MKYFFLLLFSLSPVIGDAASCCVANTSVSNLMVLPSKWQQTFAFSRSNVIGDTDAKGSSTFRTGNNKEQTSAARMDLAYSLNAKYQSGVAFRYQNKSRNFNGNSSSDSGFSDLGLSHAYQLDEYSRTWIFQTANIPTATSIYDTNKSFAVDAQGTGTYQTSLGIFVLKNVKLFDYFFSPEIHYSFARSFKNQAGKTELDGFWGASFSAGAGYIPWRSKFRYGLSLTPRLEGAKTVRTGSSTTAGKESLVWDSVVNITYSIDAQYSLGLSYVDQTFFGPARNTLLNRSIAVIFQTRWL